MSSVKPSKAAWKSFMVVPDTYLKTQQVADALGVSASTIKRWVDSGAIEAIRTMGNHRLVLLSSAREFARKEKFKVQGLLASPDATLSIQIDDQFVELLLSALKEGRIQESKFLIQSVYASGCGAVALSDHLIRPVMERIGHGWMVGSWDIYQEHQATQAVVRAITETVSTISDKANEARPLALGAGPVGDVYVLPGLLGELVLREVGWDVKNLGNNLPLRSLAKATRDYRPRLVFLTASHIPDREAFIRDYSYFYEAASQVGAAIMIGGRGLDHDLRSCLIYAGFGERMAHLAEFARRLLPAVDPVIGH